MHEPGILRDLVILFAAALPIVALFQRLKIPPVVGFLLSGALIGPHGAALVDNASDVEQLAEIGLVWLLFVVGLELSFRDLAKLGRVIVIAGSLQLCGTIAAVAAIAFACGLSLAQSLVVGFLVAHSSTAIILTMLSGRGETDSPHGRIISGILLIQDLSLIPMLLLIRSMDPHHAGAWWTIPLALLQALVALAVVVLGARLLMPAFLRFVVRLRSRELFTTAVILLCLGTSWLSLQFGLSLAIGALIAGLAISESDYNHQAIADILPFRDALNSVFFLSIGMLIPMRLLLTHLPWFVGAAVLALAIKAVIVLVSVWPSYGSSRVAVSSALSLAALGELSFVLAQAATQNGILTPEHYESFITVVVLTMVAAPFLVDIGMPISLRLEHWLRSADVAKSVEAARGAKNPVVLIIGYGLNGRHLAHVLRQAGIPYRILEMNPERVSTARSDGEPVLYGDASRIGILREAGAAAAQVVVVAISDRLATHRIVALLRHANGNASIIVRTRYVTEMDELHRLGASEVIPEEFETSVEIFTRVLRRLHVPSNVIRLQVQLLRQQGYSMLRGLDLPRQTLSHLDQILAATTTETFLLPMSSPVVGQCIRELRVRKETGATIIAIVRQGLPITNPPPDSELLGGDILVLLGSHEQLDRALRLLGEDSGSLP